MYSERTPDENRSWTTAEGFFVDFKDFVVHIHRLLEFQKMKLRIARFRLSGHPGIGDPSRVFEISPRQIRKGISSENFGEEIPYFDIVPGDWHTRADYLQNSPTQQMLTIHFEEGVPWDETPQYHEITNKIQSGDTYTPFEHHQPTIDAYRDYLTYLDQLFESIKRNGYRRQTELDRNHEFLGQRRIPQLNEIQVCIGPTGEPFVTSGSHRLRMAKILDLQSVPVRTRVRHLDWQSIRDEIVRANCESDVEDLSKYIHHPELTDIL